MFCGYCRKGVSDKKGIAGSEIKKNRDNAGKGVMALWWLGLSGAYVTLLFFAGQGVSYFSISV